MRVKKVCHHSWLWETHSVFCESDTAVLWIWKSRNVALIGGGRVGSESWCLFKALRTSPMQDRAVPSCALWGCRMPRVWGQDLERTPVCLARGWNRNAVACLPLLGEGRPVCLNQRGATAVPVCASQTAPHVPAKPLLQGALTREPMDSQRGWAGEGTWKTVCWESWEHRWHLGTDMLLMRPFTELSSVSRDHSRTVFALLWFPHFKCSNSAQNAVGSAHCVVSTDVTQSAGNLIFFLMLVFH